MAEVAAIQVSTSEAALKMGPAEVRAEAMLHEGRAQEEVAHQAPAAADEALTEALPPPADLAGAMLCVFLLSDGVFHDERSLAHLRRAVELGKVCVLVNMPGAKYSDSKDKSRDRPFPENAFNPTWAPFCPELKPAFFAQTNTVGQLCELGVLPALLRCMV